VNDDGILPSVEVRLAFQTEGGSRDPLVWLCLFEEETAIPVQVPAPSWESKRPRSSRGGGGAQDGFCLMVGDGLVNLVRPVVEKSTIRPPENRMVLAGPKRKGGDWKSRESRAVAAVLMRGRLARSRSRQEKELKWMAWVRQIEVWCVGAGWAPRKWKRK
jgi:hypothetical protein